MIQSLISQYHIPTVQRHGSVDDPVAFMQYVHDLVNAEGFVVCWPNGQRVKIKAHQYLQIHKAKEAILQDRNVVQLILEENLDDVKAHLPQDSLEAITEFENDFNACVLSVVNTVVNVLQTVRESGCTRKDFATQHALQLDSFTRTVCFKLFDQAGELSELKQGALREVRNVIFNQLTKTVKYEAVRAVWFPSVKYN